MPNFVDLQCMAVTQHALTLISKGEGVKVMQLSNVLLAWICRLISLLRILVHYENHNCLLWSHTFESYDWSVNPRKNEILLLRCLKIYSGDTSGQTSQVIIYVQSAVYEYACGCNSSGGTGASNMTDLLQVAGEVGKAVESLVTIMTDEEQQDQNAERAPSSQQ